MTKTYVLDGRQVRTLEDFWRGIGQAVNGPGGYFGDSLDALADCLAGGFGPRAEDDYIIEWRHHSTSRNHLGHPETARQLTARLARCHPDQRPAIRAELARARQGRGPTAFDWLVQVFDDHAPGRLRLL